MLVNTNCIVKSVYCIRGYKNGFLRMTSAHMIHFDNYESKVAAGR